MKRDERAIAEGVPLCIADGAHNVRVSIDENGVRAAAASVYEGGLGDLDEDVTLTFDRPFIFVVNCGAPLFVGAVNDPNA